MKRQKKNSQDAAALAWLTAVWPVARRQTSLLPLKKGRHSPPGEAENTSSSTSLVKILF